MQLIMHLIIITWTIKTKIMEIVWIAWIMVMHKMLLEVHKRDLNLKWLVINSSHSKLPCLIKLLNSNSHLEIILQDSKWSNPSLNPSHSLKLSKPNLPWIKISNNYNSNNLRSPGQITNRSGKIKSSNNSKCKFNNNNNRPSKVWCLLCMMVYPLMKNSKESMAMILIDFAMSMRG